MECKIKNISINYEQIGNGRPIIMIHGYYPDSRLMIDAWNMLDHYPRAIFAVLDRAGHNLQIEQEVLCDCLVNEWLTRIEEF